MKHFAIITLFLLVHWSAFGQSYSIKNLDLKGDIDSWYHSHFDSINAKIYIGARPTVSPPGANTNNYFTENTTDWIRGDVMFDNHLYTGVRLKYDIQKQYVYLLHPSYWEPLILDQSQVNWFRTSLGTFKPRSNSQGYSLVFYEGENLSFIKESYKRVTAKDGRLEYQRRDELYLVRDGEKSAIHKARSFIRQFPSNKKEIKDFMRSKELRQIKRRNKEEYLTRIAQYCDNLSNL